MRLMLNALGLAVGIVTFAMPEELSAQPYVQVLQRGGAFVAQQYPKVHRFVQNPAMPYSVNRYYNAGRNYFAPRQYYYAAPQYRMRTTTPMYVRRY